MFGLSSAKREVLEDVGIIGGCVAVQFMYAANSVFMSYLMSLGLNPLTIVIFTSSVTPIILFPFSFPFERSLWPKKLSLRLLMQMVLVALGGVTLFQSLFVKGVKLTSPALATTMPNLAPGLIFLIAVAFGLEKLKARCMRTNVKILGISLCVIGAIAMGIMQSTTQAPIVKEIQMVNPTTTASSGFMLDRKKIIGCIYLIVAVISLSSSVVLQAWTLENFPAPLSLSTATSLLGAIMTATLELVEDGEIDTERTQRVL